MKSDSKENVPRIATAGSKAAATVWFATGALFAAIAVYIWLGELSFSAIKKLPCEVEPNDSVAISGFEIKVLNSDLNPATKTRNSENQARMASLQWRCNVESKASSATRLILNLKFYDKDKFVLAEQSFDSNHAQGDLSQSQVQVVYSDINIEYARAKQLASCRISVQVLKTDKQLEADYDAKNLKAEKQLEADRQSLQEMEQRAALEQKHQAEQAELARIAVRRKWARLSIGMTPQTVQTILGLPNSVNYFGETVTLWTYNYHDLELSLGHVTFQNNVSSGWDSP